MLTIKNYNKLDGYVGPNFYITQVEELPYSYLFRMDSFGGKYRFGVTIDRHEIDTLGGVNKYYNLQIGNSTARLDKEPISEDAIKDVKHFVNKVLQRNVEKFVEKLNGLNNGPSGTAGVHGLSGSSAYTGHLTASFSNNNLTIPNGSVFNINFDEPQRKKLNLFQRLKSRWTMVGEGKIVNSYFSARRNEWIFFWEDCYGVLWETNEYFSKSIYSTLFADRERLSTYQATIVRNKDNDELERIFG